MLTIFSRPPERCREGSEVPLKTRRYDSAILERVSVNSGGEDRPGTSGVKRKKSYPLSSSQVRPLDPFVVAICCLWLARFKGYAPNIDIIFELGLVLECDGLEAWFRASTPHVSISSSDDVTSRQDNSRLCEPLCVLYLHRSSGTLPDGLKLRSLARCFHFRPEFVEEIFKIRLKSWLIYDSGYNSTTT